MLIGFLATAANEFAAIDGLNRVLQAGPVSPATRRAIDAELALHDTMDGYTWALRTERAFSLVTLQQDLGPGNWLTRGFIDRALVGVLDLYDRHLRSAAQPYTRPSARQRLAPPIAGLLNPYGRLATLLEPSLVAAREPAERVRAMSRSLRVLNALQSQVPPGGDQAPPSTASACPPGRRSTPSTASSCTSRSPPGAGRSTRSAGTAPTTAARSIRPPTSASDRSSRTRPPGRPDPATRMGRSDIIDAAMLAGNHTRSQHPTVPRPPRPFMTTSLLASTRLA